jgi:hypothetical protein
VADGAGFDMGRDDGDISKRSQCGGQSVDAVRVDTIVIGNQYSFHQEISNSTGERALIISGSLQGRLEPNLKDCATYGCGGPARRKSVQKSTV